MSKVVAVVGLSGVGKTSLITRIASELPLKHIQASTIIKQEQAMRQTEALTSEQLRLGDVLQNQFLLIDGFHRAIGGTDKLIVLDGHVLIDGRDGVVEVPTDVFRRIGCQQFLIIEDEANRIYERRRSDSSRSRPVRSLAELCDQQRHSTQWAKQIASELCIRCSVLRPSDISKARQILDLVTAAP